MRSKRKFRDKPHVQDLALLCRLPMFRPPDTFCLFTIYVKVVSWHSTEMPSSYKSIQRHRTEDLGPLYTLFFIMILLVYLLAPANKVVGRHCIEGCLSVHGATQSYVASNNSLWDHAPWDHIPRDHTGTESQKRAVLILLKCLVVSDFILVLNC